MIAQQVARRPVAPVGSGPRRPRAPHSRSSQHRVALVCRARSSQNTAEMSTSSSVVSPVVAGGTGTGAPLVSQLIFSVSVIACSLSVATAALMCSLIPAVKVRDAALVERNLALLNRTAFC